MKIRKGKICAVIILGVFLTGMICGKIYHEIQITKEEKELLAYGIGNFTEVDGKKINVAAGGKEDAEETIVFLHGLGMGDTVISTAPLLSHFEDQYRTCVIDRYGNGMSDDTGEPQTVDVILKEYRSVLKNLGIEGPYILVAHSIAGMYADYWGEQYPEEVKKIVYLDADPAEWYAMAGEPERVQVFLGRLQYMASFLGLQRFLLSDERLIGKDENQIFTKQQNELRMYLMLRNTYSKATQSEFENYYRNAEQVIENRTSIVIPQLYIQAVNEDSNYDYLDEKKRIMEERGNVSVVRVNGTHCLYEVSTMETADAILDFLSEMNEGNENNFSSR